MPTSPTSAAQAIVGEPEVVEDARGVETSPAWLSLKAAATALQVLQVKDGSIPDAAAHPQAREHVATIIASIAELAPRQQEIILLRFFGQLRNREIAAVLGLDERTVAAYLCRGLQELARKSQRTPLLLSEEDLREHA